MTGKSAEPGNWLKEMDFIIRNNKENIKTNELKESLENAVHSN